MYRLSQVAWTMRDFLHYSQPAASHRIACCTEGMAAINLHNYTHYALTKLTCYFMCTADICTQGPVHYSSDTDMNYESGSQVSEVESLVHHISLPPLLGGVEKEETPLLPLLAWENNRSESVLLHVHPSNGAQGSPGCEHSTVSCRESTMCGSLCKH